MVVVPQVVPPLPLAEPPEQLPEVTAAVAEIPVAPPAALPHTTCRGTIDMSLDALYVEGR